MASYTITRNLTNVASNTIKLRVAPENGYALPNTVEVLNGTLDSWNPLNGELILSNVTSTTTVNIVSVVPQIDYFSIKVDYTDNYAGTENEASNVYIGLSAYSSNTASDEKYLCDGDLEYSKDKVTWTTLAWNSDISPGDARGEKIIPVANGETVYLRGIGNKYIGNRSYGSGYKTFRMIAPETSDVTIDKLTVSGDILTLLDYENPPTSYVYTAPFAEMFNDMKNTSGTPKAQTGLKYNAVDEIDASNLILPDFTSFACYGMMFRNNGIVHMPKLPALEIANEAYRAMFSGTSEVKNITALPATKVGDSGYYSMFNSVYVMDKLPELAATEIKSGAYDFMFTGVPRDGISTESQEGLVPWYLSGSPITLYSSQVQNVFNYSDLVNKIRTDLNDGGPAVLYVDPTVFTIAKLEDL